MSKGEKLKLSIFFLFLGSLMMLSLRWVDLVLYLPFFMLYLLFAKHSRYVFGKFLLAVITGVAILLIIDGMSSSLNVFNILDQRKTITINGFASTSFYSGDWRGEGVLMVKYIPMALVNALFQPFPWLSKGALSLIASFESVLLLILVLYTVFVKKGEWRLSPLLCLLFFLSIARFTFNGLFVENAGTIIRHRSEVLGFFVIFMLAFKSNTFTQISKYLLPESYIAKSHN